LLLLGVHFSGLTRAVAETPLAASRPNILFIAVDDLRPELACYGTQKQPIKAQTPRLDSLAASGMRFTHAYCNQAVCGASRVSLMTGLYPEFTGERTYHVTDWRRRWADVVTMNQHFKANDYTTVGLGKIYHGTGGPGVDPENWTEWIKVTGKGYANPESLQQLRESKSYAPGAKTRKRGPSTEAANVADDVYADGLRASEGVRQIEKLAAADKPFFLAVGFTKPHLPFNAPTKYWDLYQREDFALPANLGVPPGYPQWARNKNAGELRAYSDIPAKGTPADFPMELNQRLLHGYHACVSYTDRNVGKLLDALEDSGAAGDTIVVFWADHGWKLGDHSSWCKHTNFECDTRVPLMIRYPKLATAKGESEAMVELIDLYPTLCELCGLKLPGHLQGKSLVPVLKDPAAKHRDYAYSSYPHTNSDTRKPVVGHSIRNGSFRYTEWWEKGTDRVVARVATDINADPGETTNVLPEDQALAKLLSADLKKRVLEARGSSLRK
jgi:arylsulfatase A-like enzyme